MLGCCACKPCPPMLSTPAAALRLPYATRSRAGLGRCCAGGLESCLQSRARAAKGTQGRSRAQRHCVTAGPQQLKNAYMREKTKAQACTSSARATAPRQARAATCPEASACSPPKRQCRPGKAPHAPTRRMVSGVRVKACRPPRSRAAPAVRGPRPPRNQGYAAVHVWPPLALAGAPQTRRGPAARPIPRPAPKAQPDLNSRIATCPR
jgi:hypothetical protein